MKFKPKEAEQDYLFRARLVEIIDMRHELVKLAALIKWEFSERGWAGFSPPQRNSLQRDHASVFDGAVDDKNRERVSVDTIVIAKAMMDSPGAKLYESMRQKIAALAQAIVTRTIDAVRHPVTKPKSVPPRLGWVTTYNSRCGIATYSEHLIRYLDMPVHLLADWTKDTIEPDAALGMEITRCWKQGQNDDLTELLSVIRGKHLQTVVIQFNYGFFNFTNLSDLISTLKDEGRQVFITL